MQRQARRYEIDEKSRQILRKTQEELDGCTLRTVRCPTCQFPLLEVYGHGHYFVRVKCRKCKFDNVFDTAFFRTVRR